MNCETQMKLNNRLPLQKKIAIAMSIIVLQACSFVELTPGANRIIFSNHHASCQKVNKYHATVRTTTMLIDRSEKAIAEELQILAQNEAYQKNANAIWPSSGIKEGQQSFDILRCKQL